MIQPSPIAAFDVFPDGRAVAASDLNCSPSDGASYRWLHFDLASDGIETWLAANLPAVPSDALLQAETRPRFDTFEDGIILNLRGVNLNPGAAVEDMVSLRIWACGNLVVSTRLRKLMAIDRIRQRMIQGVGPASVGALLQAVIDGLSDRIEEVSLRHDENTDAIEDSILETDSHNPLEMVSLRSRTIKLRRYIGPQREALLQLSKSQSELIDDDTRARIRESMMRTARAVEELDAVRDRLTALQDHLDLKASNRQARQGYLLSIIAAIFLPLGFFTGLFGVNIAGMPGLEQPYAFALLCVSMLGLSIALYVYFRWKDWL